MIEQNVDVSLNGEAFNEVTAVDYGPTEAASSQQGKAAIEAVNEPASTDVPAAAADSGDCHAATEADPGSHGARDVHPNVTSLPDQPLPASEEPGSDDIETQSGGGDGTEGGKGGEGGREANTPFPPSPDVPPPIVAPRRRAVGNDIHRPAPATNPVLQALCERGLYLGEGGQGRHRLRCPFSDDGAEAVYVEPNDGMPSGFFQSRSVAQQGKRLGDLLAHLGVDHELARCKDRIAVKKGETHRIVVAAQEVLAARGDFYAFNGQIVKLKLDHVTHEPKVIPVDEQMLLIELSPGADWVKFDGRSQSWQ